MRTRRLIAVALLTVLAILPAAQAGADSVVRLDFEKELVDPAGVWSGVVEPDGGIRTSLTDPIRETGNVWHVSFDWTVSEGPDFEAEVTGVINLRTGRVSLNGMVVDGEFEGSNIHVDAQLDLADFSSVGTMTITP